MHKNSLVPYFLAWIPMAILVGVLLVNRGHGAAAIPLSLLFDLPMAAIGASSRFMCRALPLRRHRLQVVLSATLGAAITLSGLWTLAFLLFRRLAGDITPQWRETALLLFLLGVAAFVFSLFYHYLALTAEHLREAEQKAAQALVLSRDAQLRAMRTQMNPHFLFNSLNSVTALVGSDPAAARDMIVRLASFFRATVAAGKRERIPLSGEMELIRNYLEIEKVRFGGRLEVRVDLEDRILAMAWPPLLLLPLVENAIKYGLSSTPDPVGLELTGTLEADRLVFCVVNRFDPAGRPRGGTGTGLLATRERIRLFFGEQAKLTVASFAPEAVAPQDTPGDLQKTGNPALSEFRVTLHLPLEVSHEP